MTKEELLPLAKTYFDSDPNRQSIFGTEDSHFYNTEGDARYHCKELKEYFQFTKNDFEAKLEIVTDQNDDMSHDGRKLLLEPLWEFLDESFHDSDFGELTIEDFDKLLLDTKAAKKLRDEELALEDQIKKEEIFENRKIEIAPYAEFKSRWKLTINTKQETFDKLLADLKAKESKNKK